jgi:hypothetical protein
LGKLAKDPFKKSLNQHKLLSNGAVKPKKPRPFRFPERRPKLTIKQVTRPNVTVNPTYVVPRPHVYPAYYHPYPYHYAPPTAPATKPVLPPYPKTARPNSKATDKEGRPTYPDWAQEVLGKYRPHTAVVHPGAIVHPGGTTIVPHPHFVVPDYKEWLKGKEAYLKKVSDAKLKARYQYAWDTCARRGKMWSAKRRYRCFRMMFAQYKPNKSNSLNAVRDRV